MQSRSEALKTGIEATGDKWGSEPWYAVWLCGKKLGDRVGYGRALDFLLSYARNNRLDARAARREYLAAVEAEEMRLAAQAELEAACPDFHNPPCAWMDEVERHAEVWELEELEALGVAA